MKRKNLRPLSANYWISSFFFVFGFLFVVFGGAFRIDSAKVGKRFAFFYMFLCLVIFSLCSGPLIFWVLFFQSRLGARLFLIITLVLTYFVVFAGTFFCFLVLKKLDVLILQRQAELIQKDLL